MSKSKNEGANPESVLIEVPITEVTQQSWRLHINTHLSPDQSHVLRGVTTALDQQLARLSSGRRVVNPCDALKYLVEQIGLK
jgi:hypothetical protein